MVLDSVQLATFATVTEEGSFEAAARSLHVTPSAVSQRIKALEGAVGQVLVRRTKPCQPTAAGQSLLRLAGQISLLEREALHTARGTLVQDQPRIQIAVVVNADSLATWFLTALADLPERLGLVFDVREDDQDHTAELLRDGSAMAAVTAQRAAVRGCRVERLGAMRYLAMASPDMARTRFPAGATAETFATTAMIVFNRKDQLQHRFLRSMGVRRAEPPTHHVPSVLGFTEAIRLGLGWGMMPERIAAAEIAAGRCVDVGAGRHLDVPLYWQHWRVDSDVLTTLTASVRAAAAAALR